MALISPMAIAKPNDEPNVDSKRRFILVGEI